jgi:hypothetical protein
MILIDNNFRKTHRRAVQLARADRFTVKHLDQGLYFVARKDKSKPHGQYTVTIKETKSGMFATCRRIYGGSCPHFGCCAHIAAWFIRAVEQGKKLQRRESNAA